MLTFWAWTPTLSLILKSEVLLTSPSTLTSYVSRHSLHIISLGLCSCHTTTHGSVTRIKTHSSLQKLYALNKATTKQQRANKLPFVVTTLFLRNSTSSSVYACFSWYFDAKFFLWELATVLPLIWNLPLALHVFPEWLHGLHIRTLWGPRGCLFFVLLKKKNPLWFWLHV